VLHNTGQPLISFRSGDCKVGVNTRDSDGAVLFVIKPWATEPTTKKAGQLVAGDIFVIRMQVPDSCETLVTAHAIEEIVDERKDSVLATSSLKGRITDTVFLP